MDFDLGDFTIDKRTTDLVILTLKKKKNFHNHPLHVISPVTLNFPYLIFVISPERALRFW